MEQEVLMHGFDLVSKCTCILNDFEKCKYMKKIYRFYKPFSKTCFLLNHLYIKRNNCLPERKCKYIRKFNKIF